MDEIEPMDITPEVLEQPHEETEGDWYTVMLLETLTNEIVQRGGLPFCLYVCREVVKIVRKDLLGKPPELKNLLKYEAGLAESVINYAFTSIDLECITNPLRWNLIKILFRYCDYIPYMPHNGFMEHYDCRLDGIKFHTLINYEISRKTKQYFLLHQHQFLFNDYTLFMFKCLEEVKKMKRHILQGGISLYDFILKDYFVTKANKVRFPKALSHVLLNEYDVYNELVEIFMQSAFYRDFLCKKLEVMQLYMINSIGEKIVLSRECVKALINHLDTDDLMHLVLTYGD